MLKILRDVFTGPDGESFEIAHFLWFIGVVAFVGMAIYYVLQTKTYPSNFGQDFLALNAGGAAGSFARAKSDTLNPPNGETK